MPDLDLDSATFDRIREAYQTRWGIHVYAVDPDGGLVLGNTPCAENESEFCVQTRAFAISEALRWGEPTVGFCPGNRLIWAVPLMRNERVTGGIVASVTEREAFGEGDGGPVLDIRSACADLRALAERENATNASALMIRRYQYEGEQQRAYAIHAFKDYQHNSIRELYLREEPALFSAIRAGDRGEARAILNRILVVIHHHAGDRLDLIKSIFMELVVSMSRTAVEAGGAPEELLGSNFTTMSELSKINTEAEVAHWLVHTLEHLMDAIQRSRQKGPSAVLSNAVAYIERHLSESVSRDDVARAVHLSPSHFSYLIRKESGTTFTDLLNRVRVDRAAEMLLKSDLPIGAVALQAGFRDQSYFTKVFKRYRNQTPRQYQLHAGTPSS